MSTRSSDEAKAQVIAVKLAHQGAARELLGLPIARITCGTIARELRQRLEQSLAANCGKVVYQDYIAVLDTYLIPFFVSYKFEDITSEQLSEFDRWRQTQNRRTLSTSTMRTHAEAFNRVTDAARMRGLLPANRSTPTLSVCGERGIRPLLRDHVGFLLFTGVRHGTEARRLEWRHLQWHLDGERRFFRIWVSGKTGPRLLIARAEAVASLERLAQRNHGESLNDLIESALPSEVFVCHTGYRPHGFEGSFRKLMETLDSSKTSRYSLSESY